MTKHASNGPGKSVTHSYFATLFPLPSCCVNSLITAPDQQRRSSSTVPLISSIVPFFSTPSILFKASTLRAVMMLIYSLMGPHRQSKYEDISFEYLLYLAGFLKTWLNGDCCENFHRGHAILVGVIVKFRPWANCPWSGNRLPCESLGAGERVLQKYAMVSQALWRMISLIMCLG